MLGNPWHPAAYAAPGRNVIELRRLALHDDAPKNSESYFIGKIAWWLKKNTPYNRVLSYSDTSVGHHGTIYKASNFKLVGKTAGTEKIVRDGREFHARSLSIDRDYARKLSDDLTSGKAERVKTGEKNIWILDL